MARSRQAGLAPTAQCVQRELPEVSAARLLIARYRKVAAAAGDALVLHF